MEHSLRCAARTRSTCSIAWRHACARALHCLTAGTRRSLPTLSTCAPELTAAASLRWSQPPSFRACVVVSVVRRGLDFRPFVYTSVTTSTPPSFLHAPKCTGCRPIVATLTLVIVTDRCAKIAGTVPTGRELPGVRTITACARSEVNGQLAQFGHHCIRIRCAPQSGEAELCFADDGCLQLRRALMEERRRATHRRGALRQTDGTDGLTVQRSGLLLSVANVVRMAWRLSSQCVWLNQINRRQSATHTHTRAHTRARTHTQTHRCLSTWWSGLDDAGGPCLFVTWQIIGEIGMRFEMGASAQSAAKFALYARTCECPPIGMERRRSCYASAPQTTAANASAG